MSEYKEHKMLASYIRMQYPKVIFTSDSSGIRLPIGNAKKMLALKSHNRIPDMIIMKPMGGYHGLILELKRTGESPFRKDGKLKAGEHLKGQQDTILQLLDEGYLAMFGVGFQHAHRIVDKYMAGELKKIV